MSLIVCKFGGTSVASPERIQMVAKKLAFRAAAAASRLFRPGFIALCRNELAPTAEALARAYGDVRAAAEQLHQHPNTVR